MRFEQELLFDALRAILSDTVPLKEFELLQQLQSPPWELFEKNALSNELRLFQTHFTLFHTLYQLQDYWLAEGLGYLKISALHIQLMPGEGAGLIDEAEHKIKRYYNDWRHFSQTTEQDVAALLDSFWREFGQSKQWQSPATTEVHNAFVFFTLSQKSSWSEVKRCYLKFQLDHHPDRGGDGQLCQQGAVHFDVLKRFYKTAA